MRGRTGLSAECCSSQGEGYGLDLCPTGAVRLQPALQLVKWLSLLGSHLPRYIGKHSPCMAKLYTQPLSKLLTPQNAGLVLLAL